MAKNYIDNLSEEARKGQQEKAEQGIWPTKAPLGYLSVLGADGKRIIAPDPSVASIVAKIFEWYAPGVRSLEEIADKARAAGLSCRRAALNGRQRKKLRRVKNDFAFSTFVRCGHCGCALTGDIKKGRYIYYRCTGLQRPLPGALCPGSRSV